MNYTLIYHGPRGGIINVGTFNAYRAVIDTVVDALEDIYHFNPLDMELYPFDKPKLQRYVSMNGVDAYATDEHIIVRDGEAHTHEWLIIAHLKLKAPATDLFPSQGQ